MQDILIKGGDTDTNAAIVGGLLGAQGISNIPTELVHKAHHWLILHGRYTCLARSPKCTECGLTSLCLFFKKQQSIK